LSAPDREQLADALCVVAEGLQRTAQVAGPLARLRDAAPMWDAP
jgi:hypothetical protein